jgi:hypothetical protein
MHACFNGSAWRMTAEECFASLFDSLARYVNTKARSAKSPSFVLIDSS